MRVPISNVYDEYYIIVWSDGCWSEANTFHKGRWVKAHGLGKLVAKHGDNFSFVYTVISQEESEVQNYLNKETK